MNFKAILLAMLMAVVSLEASAGAISALSPLDQQTLSTRFPPNPKLITHAVGLEEYLDIQDKQCRDKAKVLLRLIDDYAQAFHNSNKVGTENNYSRMSSLLAESSNPCHTALARAYLMGSFLISMDSTNVLGRGDIAHMRAFAYSYILLTYNLFKNNELTILDHPIEIESAHGKKQNLIGAYDCAQTLISVDISRRPLDLASLYSHELSHLLRDKFLTPDYFLSKFSDDEAGWHSYILLDESVAVANQIERQRAERQISPIGSSPEQSYQAITGMDDDTTFINWDGPVGQFLKTHQLLNWLVSEFYYKNAARDQPEDEGAAAATSEILDVVNKLYFPGSPWANSSSKLSIEIGRGFDPWPERIFALNYYLAEEVGENGHEAYYKFLYSEDQKAVLILGHGELAKLEYVLKKIEVTPSPMCSLYLTAIKHGYLENYIGTRAGGVHPGGEGSKGCLDLINKL